MPIRSNQRTIPFDTFLKRSRLRPQAHASQTVGKAVILAALFLSLLLGEFRQLKGDEAPTDDNRRAVAVALNYSRAALHRIRRNPSVRVLVEEQEKILNHLDLNGIADEEVMKLYSAVIDEIADIQIADRERDLLRERYSRAFQQELGINAFQIAAELATQQYASAVRTGANSWWDYRNMTVAREMDVWQVDKKRMTNVLEKSTQFLDTSWKMARTKHISDRWLVRSDDLDKLEKAWQVTDPVVRLRVLRRMETFMECYPPYWYYIARTQQSQGLFVEAIKTYSKLAALGTGHFRKDEMLAAGLANRAYIESYLKLPEAADTAATALSYSEDVWEANLICAVVLQKNGRYHEAEEAILRNLDWKLETTQSRVALLGLYYLSDNRPELAARLTEPEWVRDVPIPQLLQCAAKLYPASTPLITEQIQFTLQGAPRFNLGRDDFVLSAGPTWQLQNATILLHLRDKTFTNPRLTPGRDSMLVSFDGIAELGAPISTIHEDLDVSVTIKYPNTQPVRLTLKPTETNDGLGAIGGLAGRMYPVYRPTSMDQSDIKIRLRSGSPTDNLNATTPDFTTNLKSESVESPDAGDTDARTLETPVVRVPAAASR